MNSEFESEIEKILSLKSNLKAERKLSSGCAFLTDETILAYPQNEGNARYPYSVDGMTCWAYSSGDIIMNESLFTVFPDTTEGKEPCCTFYAGVKKGREYLPVAVIGRKAYNDKDTERFTVFTPQAAYYFSENKRVLSVVRLFVDDKKSLIFSFYIKNLCESPCELYQAAYFNPLLLNRGREGFEDKWYRRCELTDLGAIFRTTENFVGGRSVKHYCAVKSTAKGFKTTSKTGFNGGVNNGLLNSVSLRTGKFAEEKAVTEFTETAVFGELSPATLKGGDIRILNYRLIISDDKDYAEKLARDEINSLPGHKSVAGGLTFSGLAGELVKYEKIFTPFMNSVARQTEFCARAKSYAGEMIGVRDIFQQIEGALPIIPDYCRQKIIEALNYIGEDGRPPRQYSYPPDKSVIPAMDLREYIDQGVWVISTVYSYLCYTGDFSVLDEECGYYRFEDGKVCFSKKRDGVFEHLLQIADFLISNIDEDTGCLCALYGDWNDALDGLGRTETDKKFGNGVSVMATEQLYKSLGELIEIIIKTGKHTDKTENYSKVKKSIAEGLIKHAIIESPFGGKKILHGWGENKSFTVGGNEDSDGACRDGLTSNAFWVLSGLYKDFDVLNKEDILDAYARMDSRFGIKTFEPYFPETDAFAGRITRLPKGTAENGAVYIHATMFAVWSLFRLGEYKLAFEQLYKILPFTHEKISTSPFVMPNSYCENDELGICGESMNDWFTGSGCVLVKIIYGEIFGIKPDLNGVEISPCKNLPFKKAKCKVFIKGVEFVVEYKAANGKRGFERNGKIVKTDGLYIRYEEINTKGERIKIFD